jgi:hypothetical protein
MSKRHLVAVVDVGNVAEHYLLYEDGAALRYGTDGAPIRRVPRDVAEPHASAASEAKTTSDSPRPRRGKANKIRVALAAQHAKRTRRSKGLES